MPALDPLVRNLRVSEQTRINNLGDIIHEAIYTFFVGPHGPFTFRFTRGEDTPGAVKDVIDAMVRKLREIGAVE